MEEQRIIAAAPTGEDEALEASIRPRRLDEYLGQQPVREQLGIYIEAARARGEALDHVLIFGPPGLGKTTLSHVIANELGVNLRVTSGPVIEKAGDLAALLTNLQPHDVLFIDEIHRLSPVVEEVLYPAMEDFQIDICSRTGCWPRYSSSRLGRMLASMASSSRVAPAAMMRCSSIALWSHGHRASASAGASGPVGQRPLSLPIACAASATECRRAEWSKMLAVSISSSGR